MTGLGCALSQAALRTLRFGIKSNVVLLVAFVLKEQKYFFLGKRFLKKFKREVS